MEWIFIETGTKHKKIKYMLCESGELIREYSTKTMGPDCLANALNMEAEECMKGQLVKDLVLQQNYNATAKMQKKQLKDDIKILDQKSFNQYLKGKK